MIAMIYPVNPIIGGTHPRKFHGKLPPLKEGKGFRQWAGYALVLHATNTIQIGLIAAAVVGVLVVVAHAPEVSVVAIVLRATPPDTVVADNVEIATGRAGAAWKGGKAKSVLAIARFSIFIIPAFL
jgi:hypothetical protein